MSQQRKRRGSGRRRVKCPTQGRVDLFKLNLGSLPFKVRLAQVVELNTNGSGVLAEFISTDPSGSGSNFSPPDFSGFSSLFGGIRLLAFRVRIGFVNPDEKTTGASGIGASFNLLSTSTPTTMVSVMDNPGAKWLLPTETRQMTMRANWPRMPFAPIATPNPGSSIMAGCPGCLLLYANKHTASITIGEAYIEGIYELVQRI